MAETLRINDRWQLGADRLQWILRRRHGGRWRDVSFVSSTRDVLARCMREWCVPTEDAKRSLDRLPSTFKEWAAPALETCAAGDKPAAPMCGTTRVPKLPSDVVPDAKLPGMYRVRRPDGSLSDMVNLTRAKDTAQQFAEVADKIRKRERRAVGPVKSRRGARRDRGASRHLKHSPQSMTTVE